MPIATRTFRVFVSSTFEDLKQERDALQRVVFPKLRTLCEQHGARFQAIDLRWGVRDEAALDQRTMDICLTEIERCQKTGIKPNFIVLLGQRYGWRPLPSRIETREFEAVRDRIASLEERGLVESWYQRDDNAVPSQYLLKPRAGEWVDPMHWQELEARLHRLLLDAARAAGLSEQALVKYWASATHQEILKGLGATPEDRRHLFAFCRDVPDEGCDPDLVSLKSFLSTQLPAENILPYDPNDLEGLCHDVERTLRAVIESEAAGFESRPALALENEAHDAFARERALVFGREEVLDAINEYVRAGGDRSLVLRGATGSGKSAVMAQASERARAVLPSAVVIRRFIGASPESSSGLTLLHSLSEQIAEAYGVTAELPTDFNGVAHVFRERLGLATSERPLVFFVDALDQLGKDDPARSLNWLGAALPPYCHVVVSTTDLPPALNDCRLLKLEALPQADAATALDHWLDAARRRLQPTQRERLLAAFSRCGLPLYLKLAFEEARGWASYQSAEECLLGEGVEGVIDTLLNRLSLEANHGPLLVSRGLGYLAAARYGLTEDEMLDVLSADEEVWQDFEQRSHHTPPERRLPVIVWSRLFLDLEPYVAERSAPGGMVASFYHRQLAEQAAARFLGGEHRRKRHASLAGYFAAQPLLFKRAEGISYNRRKLYELPYQQTLAESWDALEAVLTDIDFVEAKSRAGMVFDLTRDYGRAESAWPGQEEERHKEHQRERRMQEYTGALIAYSRAHTAQRDGRDVEIPALPEPPPSVARMSEPEAADARREWTPLERVQAWEHFVSNHTVALASFHGPAFQVAYNSADSGPVADTVEDRLRQGDGPTGPWLRLTNRPPFLLHPACLKELAGHTNQVNAVAVTPDGRRAVSGSEDKTVRVWDLQTGHSRVIEGHTGAVSAVAMTPDGRRAVSGSLDETLRVWDLDTDHSRVLKGHTMWVNAVAVTPDGRRAVSGGGDNTLRVWDLDTGHSRVLKGHTMWVNAVAVTPDGRRAVSGGGDNTLRVWDLETGHSSVLRGHTEHKSVEAVAVTPDGRHAVSGSQDNTLRVWDLETGHSRVLEGHTKWVKAVAVTPDGRRAVSGGGDNTLRVWDLETGDFRVPEGHTNRVDAVAVAPDGRRAVSESWDETARVWDLETGHSRVLEGRTFYDGAVVLTPDGRRAVSGCWGSTVRVWDLETGHSRVLKGHTIAVKAVAVTPDGRRAISGSEDKTLRVWDLERGDFRVLEGHTGYVNAVAVTPDGRSAVSGSWDKTLRVWDLETGHSRVLKGDADEVSAVAVTPDGRRAVSRARFRKTLGVWDLQTGHSRVLEGHTGSVLAVALTPDGRRAISASGDPPWRWDNTMRVWDLETGGSRVLQGHTAYVGAVAVTPDGRRAVSGSDDKTLRIWDLQTGDLIAIHHSPGGTVSAAAQKFPLIVAGTGSGRVDILHLRQLPLAGPRVTTAVRLWVSAPGLTAGRWDATLTAACDACGQRFPAAAAILDAIAAITRNAGLGPDDSPFPVGAELVPTRLPAEAWDEPRLLIECPLCHEPLRFNPFVVDNRDRYP